MSDDRYAPVEFASQGATLVGRLYRPAFGQQPWPAVVMAHGLSATVTMAVDAYAEVFAAHGIAVLLYDHRGLGRSGGEPRQQINPWIQARGYMDAMTWLAARDEVDPARIAIWGDSATGNQVLVVGAVDDRVAAVVAQCPTCGSAMQDIDPSPDTFAALSRTLLASDVEGTEETTRPSMPVVSADPVGTPCIIAPPTAFRWFIEYGGRHGSGWLNRMTYVMHDDPVPFSAQFAAPFLKTPTLFMMAPEDEVFPANPEVARATFERIPEPKELAEIEKGHFGLLFTDTETFRKASGIQAEFLVRILGEAMRGVTWVRVHEFASGCWGIGGKPLSAADVKAMQTENN